MLARYKLGISLTRDDSESIAGISDVERPIDKVANDTGGSTLEGRDIYSDARCGGAGGRWTTVPAIEPVVELLVKLQE